MRLPNALQLVATAIVLYPCIGGVAQDVDRHEVFHYDPGARVFRIDAGEETYAFGVNRAGELQTIYWGGRLLASDLLPAAHQAVEVPPFESPMAVNPQEYAGWGGGLYLEPSLKITYPDGNRDLALHYVSHTISVDELTIVLKDITRNIFVTLRYTADPATGIIGRSASIENRTDASLILEQAAAGSYNLPAGDHYRLNYLTGRWAGEFQIEQRDITAGKTVLESRRGSTGHQNNPWFEIERNPSGDEQHDDIWFGALAWSGSWSMTIEQDQIRQVHVVAGFNPFDFGYKLDAGKTLTTPVFYAGFTSRGKGEASRLMHRFEWAKILPGAPHPQVRPVLFNSWEVTLSHVDEANQEALAEKVAALGVERFVVDDGWFGDRKQGHSGVGDWFVDKKKFPRGLKPLIDKVHALGMDFGIWVEPEMVDPESAFYREHSDWVLNFPGRPRTETNDRLVLNLARKDVRDYVFGLLDGLVSSNDVAFLKWDYNRNWSEPGWPEVAPDQEKNVYVDYTENLYSILRELREKHPKLEIESCSGGGGRVDLGMLGLADQAWTSDNTDPFDRLSIQDGFTQAYIPAAMMTWVTNATNRFTKRTTSLDYRFLSAMQGALGIGADVGTFTPQETAAAKYYIATYKQLRETIQHGALYRLISPTEQSAFAATGIGIAGQKAGGCLHFPALKRGTLSFPHGAPSRARSGHDVCVEADSRCAHERCSPISERQVLDGEGYCAHAVWRFSGCRVRVDGGSAMRRVATWPLRMLSVAVFAFSIAVVASGQSWTVGNQRIERTLTFVAGHGLRTSRLSNLDTQFDLIRGDEPGSTYASEFSIQCEDRIVSGTNRSLQLVGAVERALPDGKSLTITVRSPDVPLSIDVVYRVYDEQPATRKWLVLHNTGDRVLRISHLKVESIAPSVGPSSEMVLNAQYGTMPRELLYTGRSEDAGLLLSNSRTGDGFAVLNEVPGYMKRTEVDGFYYPGHAVVNAMYDTDLMPFVRSLAPGETFQTAAIFTGLVPLRRRLVRPAMGVANLRAGRCCSEVFPRRAPPGSTTPGIRSSETSTPRHRLS